MKIKGVNLGNWLVLEKWMKPAMFDQVDAEDETYLCKLLPEEEKRKRYREHRESYITETDFENIAEAGFNTVRIPVPYFLFDDIGPFLHCYEYLNQAFEWAEHCSLKILLDLHTVPGGQNGTDNSGICGVCTWSTKKEYLDMTLDVLEKMAARYGKRKVLWGIEVLNEPMCSDTPISQFMNIEMLSKIYQARDPELAKDNENYPLDYLKNFYCLAYDRMRRFLPEEKVIVFSDAFYLEGWDAFFAENQFKNIMLDTHQYLTMVEYGFGEERTLEKYLNYLETMKKQLEAVSVKIPVIVGEWSLSNSMTGLENVNDAEKKQIIQKLSDSYRRAVEVSDGDFYWSYKLDTPDEKLVYWSAKTCLENEWLKVEKRA